MVVSLMVMKWSNDQSGGPDLEVLLGHLGVGLAEAALEPLAVVSECHERAHVGKAPQAAHGT